MANAKYCVVERVRLRRTQRGQIPTQISQALEYDLSLKYK